ncbi:MAG: SDR family oxidoreductase [Sedimentisphaerales bacterium]|nr:SDR family oxidoreductase [Sedimentisphaerales bacterium]
MLEMKDKRVLVTGAGTGIGRGIALAFAAKGAAVAVHYAHSAMGANAVVEDILAAGGKAAAFKADFNALLPAREMAGDVVSFLGGLDVLVNNAGITMNMPFEKVTAEQFDVLYNVNVRAPFFLTQAVLPELETSRGVVINLSSVHAYEGYNEHSVYAGTRGAIVSFTRQLAIELAPRGVRVVGLAPGAVPVENHFKAMPGVDPQQMIEDVGNGIPCGFAGTPLDIANVAVFLASDASRYIVGQTLIVDGGTTSWMPFGDGFKKPVEASFGKGYVPGV